MSWSFLNNQRKNASERSNLWQQAERISKEILENTGIGLKTVQHIIKNWRDQVAHNDR